MPKKSTPKKTDTNKHEEKRSATSTVKKANSPQFNPGEEAVKVYQKYTKDLQGEYSKLIGSLEKFLKDVRKKAESIDKKKEAKMLKNLDKSLSEV